MKKIGFIGAFDKTDLIVYVAKILTEAQKKILVIDTTVMQKARFIIPTITPTRTYVTEFEGIDIAVGFENIESINKYIENMELDYDIMLLDIDSPEMFNSFEMLNAERLYFVTAFDNFSLKKGIEIIGKMIKEIEMTKILFERDFDETNNEYLNLLSLTSPIKWKDEIIYFPYDQGDLTAIIENQRVSKIKFKNLSEQYRDSLYIVAQEIIPDIKSGLIRKIIKNI